ncbi:hypothetical protein PUNSTDRAFT_126249 [Punctularia strigosozonata HHB-11173 SS5]|uniref:uncharacterized protein n=1 Tax=Punctularia strigosozonata (strain HHB-11173) TaxID=741275 RepID=UPI00044180C8|nr:uncharacterized protein PUNSTDRAFT_126249 [Punctularia strigosozonata HHB-11173 SS5]EIN09171.1 hypothetical protein PUNSTDRAFT_126249 [Punctularia strigosozonata HHB-11173 SS5]
MSSSATAAVQQTGAPSPSSRSQPSPTPAPAPIRRAAASVPPPTLSPTYDSFLYAYPYPAFVLPATPLPGRSEPSLEPLFVNSPLGLLLLGSEWPATPTGLAGEEECGYERCGRAFLEALGTTEAAQAFARWMSGPDASFELALHLRWAGGGDAAEGKTVVTLDVTKTRLSDVCICTSVPRSPLPTPRARASHPSLARAPSPDPSSPILKRKNTPPKMPHFPSIPTPSRSASPSTQHRNADADDGRPQPTPEERRRTRAPHNLAYRPPGGEGSVQSMIASFDWSKTSLGPREKWPLGSETVLSYVLHHPFPTALFWGPQLTMIYNDAYVAMAGSKHPAIWGKEGAVAWAELWEDIGPLAEQVMEGTTVFRHDDLLFFNRLTEDKLPEETYHSWSYTPARQHSSPSPSARQHSPPSPSATPTDGPAKRDPRASLPSPPNSTPLDPTPRLTLRAGAIAASSTGSTAAARAPSAIYPPTPMDDDRTPAPTYMAASISDAAAAESNERESADETAPGAANPNPIIGFVNTTLETTKKVLAERRLSLTRHLVSGTALTRTTAEFAKVVIDVLSGFSQDVPFAALWFCDADDSPGRYRPDALLAVDGAYDATADHDVTGRHETPLSLAVSPSDGHSHGHGHGRAKPPSRVTLRLAGALGIPLGHAAAPETVSLGVEAHGSAWTGAGRSAEGESSFQGSSLALGSLGAPVPEKTRSDGGESSRSGRSDASANVARRTMWGPQVPTPAASAPGSLGSGRAQGQGQGQAGQEAGAATAYPWPFEEALGSQRPVYMPAIPPSTANALEKRGWGDVPREAVVIPIGGSEEEEEEEEDGGGRGYGLAAMPSPCGSLGSSNLNPLASRLGAAARSRRGGGAGDLRMPKMLLVVGLNTRRPYDEEYREWVEMLKVSLDSTLGAVLGRQADIQRANQLAQLDNAKTAFFSNVSHELRTPLTLIKAPLEDCIAHASDGPIKERLKLAVRNVTRLGRLVDSLMDFSRLAAQRLQGKFHPVDISVFTADLASLFRSTIEKNGISYDVQYEPAGARLLYVDPDMWEKIVFNLIGNAFKYTMSGSIQVRIRYTETHGLFIVEDTGVGIGPDDVDKVFGRFYRVDSVSRSHEGTGIGLALTKPEYSRNWYHFTGEHLPHADVVEEDASMLSRGNYARGIVEEASRWGAAFTSTDGQTPSDTSEQGMTFAVTPSGSNSSGSSGGRVDPATLFFQKSDVVLLVDDNMDMRKYVKAILSPYCTVVEARHGQEALTMLEGGLPNVVLSDIMMPVMDGFALLEALRSRKDTRLIPVILLTALAGNEARVEGLLSGADDYLPKPFSANELVARVHLQMLLGKRRIELEARFEERTQEIQLLSELSPVGICRSNRDGRVIYANPRFLEYSQHSAEEQDMWQDAVHPEDQSSVSEAWNTAYTKRESASVEFRFSSGTWFLAHIQPLMDGGCLATITDINAQRLYETSELLRSQEREASARKRAEEAEQQRQEADDRRRGQELLIDVTSHELRQPVSAILNCSALVRANLASLRDELWNCSVKGTAYIPPLHLFETMDEDLDALDSIYQCGLAQERIANDVLSLSRIQLQVLNIVPTDFELIGEVQRILSRFRNEAKMKRIQLTLQTGVSLTQLGVTYIVSDKSRFGQVITNLLSNAIKFTDMSTSERKITVTVEASVDPPAGSTFEPSIPLPLPGDVPPLTAGSPIYIFVTVKDSGPGLQPDDLDRLFQRFQQGSNSHDVFGGSGLGLFVSRQLCNLMGGRIGVQSVHGQGALFYFFIEARVAESSSPTTPFSETGDPILAARVPNSRKNISDPRISYHVLVCEDNLINQTVLVRQLKKVGCTTAVASNGLQALEQIRTLAAREPPQTFDAILMDQEMPLMDGSTAVRRIRQMEQTGQIPKRNRIFALTGNARGGQVENIRQAGVDDVLIKPYKFEEVLDRILSPS